MSKTARCVLVCAALLFIAHAPICIASARGAHLEHGQVILETLDRGKFQMRIVRRGENPEITCNIVGYISKGVVPSSEVKRFAIHRRYRNGQQWSTYGNPLAGYMYFFRQDGNDLVDIQLLFGWHTDSHERRPQKEGINGIYPVSGAGLEIAYEVNVRPGRRESWLESK